MKIRTILTHGIFIIAFMAGAFAIAVQPAHAGDIMPGPRAKLLQTNGDIMPGPRYK